MRKNVDCLMFEDQLDAAVQGSIPEEGLEQLRLHALSCPDCAMLLRVKEHLALPSLEELEQAVPQEFLESMWPRLEGKLRAGEGLEGSPATVPMGPPPSLGFPWLVPSLAAASMVLLLSTGFLFSELRKTAARGDQLVLQVTELRENMDELEERTQWVERTAQLAGSGRNRARALTFQFAGQESISVGALVELLQRYPPETVLLDTSELRALFGPSRQPPPELKEILAILEEFLSPNLDDRRVSAGDLAEWLTSADIPSDLTLPKASLIELLS